VDGPLLEPAAAAWLHRALPGLRIEAAEPLGGGYRNENIRVVTDRGSYVLRRYRRSGAGTAGAAGAGHAGRTCAVEAALAARLAATAVPAAAVIAADPAGSAAGEPLLLARHVPGVMVSEALAADPGSAAELGVAAGRALAAVGSVTFARGGAFTGPDLVPSADGWPASLPEFTDSCLRAGHAAAALSPAEIGGLRALAAAADPLARSVTGARQLVHSDYNGKNLLAVRRGGRWSISAVLDWEFAFSGSPLADVGNMLRSRGARPPGFDGGFIAGYREAGGVLPPRWREISEALDLYALADFLTRPPGHRYFGKAVSAIRDRLDRDGAVLWPKWLHSRDRTRPPLRGRIATMPEYDGIVQPDHPDPVRR
jgi:aminoglycoside phosphotransferase (APT) family kinase protein